MELLYRLPSRVSDPTSHITSFFPNPYCIHALCTLNLHYYHKCIITAPHQKSILIMPYCVMPPSSLTKTTVTMMMMMVLVSEVSGQPQENASEALLKFKTALANTDPALANWDPSTPPCSGNTGNWAGVLCFNGYAWGLQLENKGLQGQIDVEALTGLPYLRTLSFSNNTFQGSMPDWRKLKTLKSLYLDGNSFSGHIPNDAFTDMPSLKKVYLSNNKFTGPIPASLASSPAVAELGLNNNQFSGAIPAPANSANLKVFNVSNNHLQGPVPPALLGMDPSSFGGNKALCGSPGGPPCNPPKPPPDLEPVLHPPPPGAAAGLGPARRRKPSPARIVLMILSVVLALFLILLLLMLCWRTRTRSSVTPKQGFASEMPSPYNYTGEKMMRSSVPMAVAVASSPRAAADVGSSPAQQQAGKLSFVRDDRQKFDLQDLMRASAEVLGCGNFGASYKAVLVDGEALVVKRFKQMNNIGKEEFHDHMRRLGALKHPNLLPLVAYLYRKEEKLLVFDFISNNSLAKHLHDDGTLYAELPNLDIPHGHLKSSNVLVDSNYNALLMDYTLSPVVNPTQIDQALVAYKCPEYAHSRRTSRKSDVWCLGILIMETLTAKHVPEYLAKWVNDIIQEASIKGPRQVFDKEMEMGTERSRLQVEKLLQIGIACCREDMDKRLGLEEALRNIDQLQE